MKKLVKNGVMYFSLMGLLVAFPLTSQAISFGSAGQHIDDTVITSKVKLKYARDRLLKSSSLSVSTAQGVVTVSGAVNSDAQFERAVILAETTGGVKDVNADALTVASSKKPLKDLLVTAKIKASLIKRKFFKADLLKYWTVDVETKNGVVYLTGQVSSQSEKDNLINLVKSVKGVQDVKADFQIEKN